MDKAIGFQKNICFCFIVIHTVKGFGIVNKAEIDVFLELSCFVHDPADVGNLISDSSAFSKTTWHTSTAERSYPTSEIRGRRWEDPMPEGQQPRGATPTSEVRGSGQGCQAAMAQ